MSGQQALEGNGATVGSTMSDQGTAGSRLSTQAVDVKVLAADAHPVTLLGLQHVLQSDPALQLVGTCGTGAQALQLCASLRPSLLITDVSLPGLSGIDLVPAVK